MKIQSCLTFCLFLSSFCFHSNAVALINIKDYGAVGDGSDATAAIRNALNDAANQTSEFSAAQHSGNAALGTCPRVYFPAGKYKINQTIRIPSAYVQLEGESAIIQPTNSFNLSLPAFESRYPNGSVAPPYRYRIKGLSFMGFRRAIRLGGTNINVGQSMTVIEKCQFVVSEIGIEYGNRSSLLTVRDCRFDKVRHAIWVSTADRTHIENCWFSSTSNFTNSRQACIEHRSGTLTVKDSMFVPANIDENSTSECAWINIRNSGSSDRAGVIVKDCRVGGEFGGLTLINFFAPPDLTFPSLPSHCIVTNNDLDAGQTGVSNQTSIVRLFQVPNMTTIKDNYGLIGNSPIEFGSGINPNNLLSFTDTPNTPLTVTVSGNSGGGANIGDGNRYPNYVPPVFSGKANLR